MDYYNSEELHHLLSTGTGSVDTDKKYFNTLTSEHCIIKYTNWLKQQDKIKNQKNYYYLITFTLRNKDDATSAEAYIKRQTERTALNITSYEYCKEYTKNNMPHWHASVITTKPLKKDRFHYYIKKYGNIDLSRSRAQHDFESLNYISKSSTPTKIL